MKMGVKYGRGRARQQYTMVNRWYQALSGRRTEKAAHYIRTTPTYNSVPELRKTYQKYENLEKRKLYFYIT